MTRYIVVDGKQFVAVPEHGCFYEADDPTGTIGRLCIPMFKDGSPDLDNLTEIEVAYEDAEATSQRERDLADESHIRDIRGFNDDGS